MNKVLVLLVVILLGPLFARCQAPSMFNYQGVARNSAGAILAGQSIGIRFTVHQGTVSGTSVYQEENTATTNQFGLFNLVIGTGSNVIGDLDTIAWGTDSYFLQVEMDPDGGTGYSDMGTTQLLSVPYAIYAGTSGQTDVLPTGNTGQTLRHNGTDWVNTSSLYNSGNNIGIGTSTPLMKLHVEDPNGQGLLGFNGIYLKTNSAFGGSAVMMRTDSDSSAAIMGLSGTGTQTPNTLLLMQAAANPIALGTDGLDRMTITGEGDVSVGHHQPQARLHVDGNTLFEGGDNTFNASVNNNEGNMGIGLDELNQTVFSDYKLSVSGIGNGVLKVHNNFGGQAGLFEGDVDVTGMLSKGAGSFKIDHPLDPENKFLYHSFVESPDMMNIYNGIVTTDEEGIAVVQLPDYFDSLNKDFRYQLTPIGGLFQVAVLEEVSNNVFKVISGQPNAKVSWQITGIRKDAYAEKNRIQVSVDKNELEKGKYLHPDAFGISDEKKIRYGTPAENKKR